MVFRSCGVMPHLSTHGEGAYFQVAFQGCLQRCIGCNNENSWPLLGGIRVNTEDVIRWLRMESETIDALVLTGGEPFLQPSAALLLAKEAHALGLRVWCYTGYLWEKITKWNDVRAELLREIDVLIDGPFDQALKSSDLAIGGSVNQRTIDVNESLKKEEIVPYKLASFTCQKRATASFTQPETKKIGQ